jgi:hypothetical protein
MERVSLSTLGRALWTMQSCKNLQSFSSPTYTHTRRGNMCPFAWVERNNKWGNIVKVENAWNTPCGHVATHNDLCRLAFQVTQPNDSRVVNASAGSKPVESPHGKATLYRDMRRLVESFYVVFLLALYPFPDNVAAFALPHIYSYLADFHSQ